MYFLEGKEEILKLPICPSAYDVTQKLCDKTYSGEDYQLISNSIFVLNEVVCDVFPGII